MHTISWSKVCRPKEIGGLGMPNLHLLNETCMEKLGWRFRQSNVLWYKVLKGKYGSLSQNIKGAQTLEFCRYTAA